MILIKKQIHTNLALQTGILAITLFSFPLNPRNLIILFFLDFICLRLDFITDYLRLLVVLDVLDWIVGIYGDYTAGWGWAF
jgi:hypothetical protein